MISSWTGAPSGESPAPVELVVKEGEYGGNRLRRRDHRWRPGWVRRRDPGGPAGREGRARRTRSSWGTCLNRGCIPSKALLDSASRFETLKHAADYGLRAESIGFDFSQVQ